MLTSIWRYPVKSMRGERIEQAEVSPAGVSGDRTWAVVSRQTGLIGSAKHPRQWARLLQCRSSLHADGHHVSIELPDGVGVSSEDPAVANAALSDLVGSPVELRNRASLDGGTIERTDPREDDFEGAGPLALEDIATFGLGTAATGSLFDFAAVHVLTTGTLGALAPQVGADVEELRARFRPNLVVDLGPAAFDENNWTGGEIQVGDLTLRVVLPTPRCIVPTLAQPGLASNAELARTLARINRVEIPGFGRLPTAGAYCSPQGTATAAVGGSAFFRTVGSA